MCLLKLGNLKVWSKWCSNLDFELSLYPTPTINLGDFCPIIFSIIAESKQAQHPVLYPNKFAVKVK